MLIVTSFIGFAIENAWFWITKSYVDNRNMNLPFLFGYGFAVAAIYLMVGTPSNGEGLLKEKLCLLGNFDIMYFGFVFLFVSVGEICLGYAFRAACRFDYWDYSDLPLHFTKYTSFFTSVLFAGAIYLFMNYCFEIIMHYALIKKHTLTYLLDCLIIGDFLYSFGYMMKEKKPYVKWKKIQKKHAQKKARLREVIFR